MQGETAILHPTVFTLLRSTVLGRRGRLQTAHGTIETPFFLPVATGGAMRGITLSDLEVLKAQALLCNTYHLHLQPGEDVVARAGGLHSFIGWDKPILTDSGGFQVFSLKTLRTIREDGVEFQSHLDGSPRFLGPEEAMHIQHKLGSDMIMCFDEVHPSTAPRSTHVRAVDRTLRWARACKRAHERLKKDLPALPAFPPLSGPLLFGIVQGGLERDLREKCAEELRAIEFDGYAIGGLAVGESEQEMFDVLDAVCPLLPKDKPRYLMGVGRIGQLRAAVARGIDMFDCVLPMRVARHGEILLSSGEEIRIMNSRYRTDHSLIDPDSPSPLSRRHTKSYVNYLFRAKERSSETIACMQNLGVTLEAMRNLRKEMNLCLYPVIFVIWILVNPCLCPFVRM